MRTYHGERRDDGCFVEVIVSKPDGSAVISRHPLDPVFHLVNGSTACAVVGPTYEWRCAGVGAERLALAILANCLGGAEAKEHYRAFITEVICELAENDWTLTEAAIGAWHLKQHKAQLEGER